MLENIIIFVLSILLTWFFLYKTLDGGVNPAYESWLTEKETEENQKK